MIKQPMGMMLRASWRRITSLPGEPPRSATFRYGIAALTVLVALALKLGLDPALGEESPFLLFFAAVTVSAWIGGLGPGLGATATAALLTAYFFFPPYFSLAIHDPRARLRLLAFVLEAAFVSLLSGALRTAVVARQSLVTDTENRRAAAEAQASVSTLFSQSLDLQEVQQRIVDSVRQLFGAHRTALYRLEPESGDFVALAASDTTGSVCGSHARFPRGTGLIGVMARAGRPLVTSDVLADSRVALTPAARARIEQNQYPTVLAVPLVSKGALIGALSVADRAKPFSDDDVRLAQTFANQAAIAWENARLYASQDLRARRLHTLARLTQIVTASLDVPQVLGAVARAAAELTQAAAVTAWTADETTQTLELRATSDEQLTASFPSTRRRFGEGGSGWVAQHRRSLHVPDVSREPRIEARAWYQAHGLTSALLAPILAPGAFLGVLAIMGRRPFDLALEEQELLDSFIAQAGVAIQNARLYEAAQARRREAEELARLAAMLTESLDVAAVGDRIVQSVLPLFGVQSASLRLIEPDGALRALVVGGRSSEHFPPDHVFPPGAGAAGRAAEGSAVRSPDVLQEPGLHFPEDIRQRLQASGLAAVLAVALRVKGDIIGTLSIADRTGRIFSNAEVELLQAFADQAAIAIRNARLYQDLRLAHQQLARSQAQLVHSEKLAALGQLVAGVAHELNNPLMAVLGNAELLERATNPTQMATYAARIRPSAERAAQIVRNLLHFARRSPPRREPVAINALVERVVELTAHALATDNIALVRDFEARVPTTAGDAGQLEQLLLILLTNAAQAMAKTGGTLSLRTRHTGNTLRVEVADTGPGVPPSIRAKIFDPFFTTKPVGTGTGLGLSVAHGIVAAHEGQIWLDEAAEAGATFVVELPIQAAQPSAGPADPTPLPRRGRLLVVDDEVAIREVLRGLLTKLGCDVVLARSAREARAILAREHFDLIALDLLMPEESGADLWQDLHVRMPTVATRVVFITGAADAALQRFVESTGRPVLAKPFTLEQLARVVSQELVRSASGISTPDRELPSVR